MRRKLSVTYYTRQANRATPSVTRSRSDSDRREWSGSASARSKAGPRRETGPGSRTPSAGAARTCRSAPGSPRRAASASASSRPVEPDDVRLPAVRVALVGGGGLDEAGKPLGVARGDSRARGEQLVQPAKLRDPDGAEDVRQTVVEAGSERSRTLRTSSIPWCRSRRTASASASSSSSPHRPRRSSPSCADGSESTRAAPTLAHGLPRRALRAHLRRPPRRSRRRRHGVRSAVPHRAGGRRGALEAPLAIRGVTAAQGRWSQVDGLGIDVHEHRAGPRRARTSLAVRKERVRGNRYFVALAEAEGEHGELERRTCRTSTATA